MSRPLGYSVERQDDGRIALIEPTGCNACWNRGKNRRDWTVTCPAGCTFTTAATPSGGQSAKCKVCGERWSFEQYTAVENLVDCRVCKGTGRGHVEHMFEVEAARALRDALTAALGEPAIDQHARARAEVAHLDRLIAASTSPLSRMSLESRREEVLESFPEVPDASVASEGPAKGAGSSTPERARVICPECCAKVVVDTSAGCIECPACRALMTCHGCGMDISGGPWTFTPPDAEGRADLRCAECVDAGEVRG